MMFHEGQDDVPDKHHHQHQPNHMSMSRDLKDNLEENYAQIKDFIYQKYKHQDQYCTKIVAPLFTH